MYTQFVTVVLLYTGIDDLFKVKMTLKNLNDWQSLGLALGLLYHTLERIEEDHCHKLCVHVCTVTH